MTESSNDEQLLEAARHCYRQIKTQRGDPAVLVPKIRGYLREANADAGALSLSGDRSADSIEQELQRYESMSGAARER